MRRRGDTERQRSKRHTKCHTHVETRSWARAIALRYVSEANNRERMLEDANESGYLIWRRGGPSNRIYDLGHNYSSTQGTVAPEAYLSVAWTCITLAKGRVVGCFVVLALFGAPAPCCPPANSKTKDADTNMLRGHCQCGCARALTCLMSVLTCNCHCH